MNKSTSLMTIISVLLIIYATGKLGVLPSHLVAIHNINERELKGQYVSQYEKSGFLNKQYLTIDIIGFILYLFLLIAGVGSLFKKEIARKTIIAISLLVICVYWPVFMLITYIIFGKSSLMGLVGIFFSYLFHLFLIFYFSKNGSKKRRYAKLS